MADGRVLSSSEDMSNVEDNCDQFNIQSDCQLFEYLSFDGKKLKWTGTFELLKKFVKEDIGQQGRWSAPGGNSKRFKDSEGRLTITWYHKKQKTLMLQGTYGELLKMKLCELQNNTNQTTTTTQSQNKNNDAVACSPISLETCTSPLLQTSAQNLTVNSEIPSHEVPDSTIIQNTQDRSVTHLNKTAYNVGESCHGSCRVLTADIEGIKLDIAILEHKIEEINSTKAESNKNKEKVELERQFCEIKETCKTLKDEVLSLQREKESIIKEKNAIIYSLESRLTREKAERESINSLITKTEEERDSLKLAFSLIIQDNALEHNTAFAEPNKRNVSKAPTTMKQVKQTSLHLTNQFDTLPVEELNSNDPDDPEDARIINQSVQSTSSQNRASNKASQNTGLRKQKVNVSDSTRERKPTTVILGDSMTKGIRPDKIGKSTGHKVYSKSFPGSTTIDMKDYIKPSMRRKPDNVIIHIGTNDLKTKKSKEIVNEINNIGKIVNEISPETNITISEIITREDHKNYQDKIKEVNEELSRYCHLNKWCLLKHPNIDKTSLNQFGLHLNKKGISALAKNVITHLKLINGV